jgi:hypothetical protein
VAYYIKEGKNKTIYNKRIEKQIKTINNLIAIYE